MKTVLEGLQPCNDPAVNEMAERLASRLDPDLIYFFGSRARGDEAEFSDYDLMVITPEYMDFEDYREHTSYAEDVVSDRVYSDILVWGRKEFEVYLHLKASLPSRIVDEGKVIYARPGIQPYPRNRDERVKQGLGMVCEHPPEYDPVRRALMFDLLNMVRADLKAAKKIAVDADESDRRLSMFHCQQCVEKAMKAFLQWKDHPARDMHELKELHEQCVHFDASLSDIFEPTLYLTDWAVKGRYSRLWHFSAPNFTAPAPSPELVAKALEDARIAHQAITDRLPKQQQSSFDRRE